MADTFQIKVDKKLVDVLYKMQKEITEKIKKEFGLDKITIFGTTITKILAENYSGKKEISFKIRKTGLTEGIIEVR